MLSAYATILASKANATAPEIIITLGHMWGESYGKQIREKLSRHSSYFGGKYPRNDMEAFSLSFLKDKLLNIREKVKEIVGQYNFFNIL